MEPVSAAETFIDVHFAKAGVDKSRAFWRQKARDVGEGEYARSTPEGVNVRGHEPGTNRSRGGSRAGLEKFISTIVSTRAFVVQELAVVTASGIAPPGGNMQLSQSSRVVTLIAVSRGRVYTAGPGATVWSEAANETAETPPLNYSGVLFSAANIQKLWFADGMNYAFYDPDANGVKTWVARAGTLPVDEDGNTPRLICTWRGRTVLSGLLNDPQNWFMSAVNDPLDFDYGPESVTPTQAVAGNNSPLGLIGDVITALIPYTDDVLVFGGDHTIYMMRGDPMAGGQIDLVSDAIGMAWGQAWAKDPAGVIYFFSSRTGIYTLIPGQQPVRISQGIEQYLQDIDTGQNSIRMLWDDRFQGLHVWVTWLAEPDAATHFFFEKRTGAWWVDRYANDDHNPLTCCVLDGNESADRVPLIGCWDGYVRALTPTATDDDGTPIASAVVIGPLTTKDLDELLVKDLQAVLGETSGAVTYDVHVGRTAEQALQNSPVVSGTWAAGRNLTNLVRRAGHAVYVRLSGVVPWAMESVRVRLTSAGKVRRRGQ